MGVLMIQCPKTGRSISTGIEIDQSEFDHSAVFFGRTRCPICQTNHEWFARDAWIVGRIGVEFQKGETRQMSPKERAIVLLNIHHFRELLKTETNLAKRKTVATLLAEEEEKLTRVST